jgi:hypothetical protein
MKKQLLGAATVALLAYGGAAQATPLTLVDDGITYTLTETATANPLVASFDLNITGINGTADTEKGRSGINAIAFTMPNNFVSAVMTAPPGFTFSIDTGLNSSGCHGTDQSFFCFANSATPPTTPALAANSSLDLLFTETISSGTFANYKTDLKIDWVGNKNNYDLVSMNLPVNVVCTTDCGTTKDPVPEPASIALLSVGVLGLGVLTRRRRSS